MCPHVKRDEFKEINGRDFRRSVTSMYQWRTTGVVIDKNREGIIARPGDEEARLTQDVFFDGSGAETATPRSHQRKPRD